MKLVKIDKKLSDAINRACDTWGESAQENLAVEEMAELTQALMKVKRLEEGDPNVVGVIEKAEEEIADALMMVLQLAFRCYNTEKIEKWMHFKLDRLNGRLDDYDRMFNQKQKNEN